MNENIIKELLLKVTCDGRALEECPLDGEDLANMLYMDSELLKDLGRELLDKIYNYDDKIFDDVIEEFEKDC